MTLPAYFLSPEWAIIASQLLVAMTLLVLFLAAAIWRRNRRARRAIQRLLADRNAIRQAGEHVLDRLPEDQGPDESGRVAWVDRSLELLEPLAAACLDAKRHGPEEVMRRLLVIRQEDLHQRLAEPALSTREANDRADHLRRSERERSGSMHEPVTSRPDERHKNAPDTHASDLVDRDRPD
ncbi:MAG: hypothetical protein ACQER6_09465 [Pseudomonadota bacterium]